MPPRVLAIGDPSRPLIEDNAIAVTVGSRAPREPRQIPLWIECAVPAHDVEAGPSYLRALRGRVTHVAAAPAAGFAAASDRARLAVRRPAGRAARTPVPETTPPASLPMPLPPALISPPTPRPLDILGAPHATAIKNLYLVGRENLPGLGLEGELISGWGWRAWSAPAPPASTCRRGGC